MCLHLYRIYTQCGCIIDLQPQLCDLVTGALQVVWCPDYNTKESIMEGACLEHQSQASVSHASGGALQEVGPEQRWYTALRGVEDSRSDAQLHGRQLSQGNPPHPRSGWMKMVRQDVTSDEARGADQFHPPVPRSSLLTSGHSLNSTSLNHEQGIYHNSWEHAGHNFSVQSLGLDSNTLEQSTSLRHSSAATTTQTGYQNPTTHSSVHVPRSSTTISASIPTPGIAPTPTERQHHQPNDDNNRVYTSAPNLPTVTENEANFIYEHQHIMGPAGSAATAPASRQITRNGKAVIVSYNPATKEFIRPSRRRRSNNNEEG
jgi:hypothetical protein